MSKEVTIMTPEQVELKFELAGLGSRFVAMLVDTLIQALVAAALVFGLVMAASGMPQETSEEPSTWAIAIMVLIVFSAWSGYFLFFESTRNGQTPGKKSAGIRVIRDTGHPVDFRSALLRNVMRLVDAQAAYGVGFISIFLSPQHRRLGDYVAGTLVVKTQQKVQPAPVAPEIHTAAEAVEPVLQEPLIPVESLPYLKEITRDDFRAIRHFLDRRRELQAPVARNLATRLSEPLAKKIGIDPASIENPVSFLENLGSEWERRMIH